MDNMINWAEDDPGGGGLPQPEEPEELNQYRDNSYMILLRGTDDELKRTSLRTLYQILKPGKVIKNIYNCTPLKPGEFLLKINKSEKDNILKIKRLTDTKNNIVIPVEFTEAWNMNRTKVSIRSEDLVHTNNDELTEDLIDQNPGLVISAEIQTKWDQKDKRINTPFATVILEGKFSEIELAKIKLNLNFQKLSVKLFYPEPRRCKICWSYEHFSSKKNPCKQTRKCGNCGINFHLKTDGPKILEKCGNAPKCLNCGKDHPAWSKDCNKYHTEKKIWEVATKQRISYKHSRYLLNLEREKNLTGSYASMTNRQVDRRSQPEQQRDKQSENKVMQEEITKLNDEIKYLTNLVVKLCHINKVTISESDETETDMETENINDEESDTDLVPATPDVQQRPYKTVQGLTNEETLKFGLLNLQRRGTQNPAPLYNRAKNRQETNASKLTESKTPSKKRKVSKPK